MHNPSAAKKFEWVYGPLPFPVVMIGPIAGSPDSAEEVLQPIRAFFSLVQRCVEDAGIT